MDVSVMLHAVVALEGDALGLQIGDDVVHLHAHVPDHGVGPVGPGEVRAIDRQPGGAGAIAQNPVHPGVRQIQPQHVRVEGPGALQILHRHNGRGILVLEHGSLLFC
ncbi:hypothetical protein D3C73_1370270 [compost metagenome]